MSIELRLVCHLTCVSLTSIGFSQWNYFTEMPELLRAGLANENTLWKCPRCYGWSVFLLAWNTFLWCPESYSIYLTMFSRDISSIYIAVKNKTNTQNGFLGQLLIWITIHLTTNIAMCSIVSKKLWFDKFSRLNAFSCRNGYFH